MSISLTDIRKKETEISNAIEYLSYNCSYIKQQCSALNECITNLQKNWSCKTGEKDIENLKEMFNSVESISNKLISPFEALKVQSVEETPIVQMKEI